MSAETSPHSGGSGRSADLPALSVVDIQHRLAAELSRGARIGHTLLLLVNLVIAVGVVSLLLTEPALPARAVVAFALMLTMALSWVGFAWWTLTRRQVRLAGHEVVASWLAVAFCGVLVAGSVLLAFAGPSAAAASLSAAMGGLLLAAAVVRLRQARRRLDQLRRRRDALERMLQNANGSRS